MKVLGSVAKTAYYYKNIQGLCPNWKLQYKLKCKSTEYELTNWLQDSPIKRSKPIAIVAKEQLLGIGQNSRPWFSPKGGIWLSAAYPIFSSKFSSEIFSLSLAIKLCEMLNMESIKVDLKWPNDIFFDSKKLIGFLPRVITRGKEIKTIHESVECNDRKEYIINNANKHLTKKHLPRGYNSNNWAIKEVDSNGNLRIFNENQEKILTRF